MPGGFYPLLLHTQSQYTRLSGEASKFIPKIWQQLMENRNCFKNIKNWFPPTANENNWGNAKQFILVYVENVRARKKGNKPYKMLIVGYPGLRICFGHCFLGSSSVILPEKVKCCDRWVLPGASLICLGHGVLFFEWLLLSLIEHSRRLPFSHMEDLIDAFFSLLLLPDYCHWQ